VIVDALGNPLALSLTGGNAHDISQAEPLAAQVEPEALLGDKGYDADSFITSLEVRANPQGSTGLRLRTLRRAKSRRAILQYHQALSRYRDTLRKDRAQLPGSPCPSK
jgi:IS5 family transposase